MSRCGSFCGSSMRRCSSRSPTVGWTAVHHPFTSPKPEYADTFQDVPGEALAYAYDIVVNGSEIGGGSIRIHRGEMQQRVFDVIGPERRTKPNRSSASCSRRSRLVHRRARWHRARLGPRAHDADGHRESIREVIGVSEDGVWRRSTHGRTDDHHRAAAQRGRH